MLALVDFWAQDNQFGKRVNATLTGVQFVRDGDSFGGARVAAADDFDVLDDAEPDDGCVHRVHINIVFTLS